MKARFSAIGVELNQAESASSEVNPQGGTTTVSNSETKQKNLAEANDKVSNTESSEAAASGVKADNAPKDSSLSEIGVYTLNHGKNVPNMTNHPPVYFNQQVEDNSKSGQQKSVESSDNLPGATSSKDIPDTSVSVDLSVSKPVDKRTKCDNIQGYITTHRLEGRYAVKVSDENGVTVYRRVNGSMDNTFTQTNHEDGSVTMSIKTPSSHLLPNLKEENSSYLGFQDLKKKS